MDEALIKQWNHYVQPGDVVYHLGDFSFYGIAKTRSIVERLNGTKIFIRGNHDKHTDQAYYDMGFTAVLEQAVVRLNKKIRVKLCHYPYIGPEEAARNKLFTNKRPVKEDMWLIHGHTHSRWKIKEKERMICVCWDAQRKFLTSSELLSIIEKQEGKQNNETNSSRFRGWKTFYNFSKRIFNTFSRCRNDGTRK